jgi:hypothetical protein
MCVIDMPYICKFCKLHWSCNILFCKKCKRRVEFTKNPYWLIDQKRINVVNVDTMRQLRLRGDGYFAKQLLKEYHENLKKQREEDKKIMRRIIKQTKKDEEQSRG